MQNHRWRKQEDMWGSQLSTYKSSIVIITVPQAHLTCWLLGHFWIGLHSSTSVVLQIDMMETWRQYSPLYVCMIAVSLVRRVSCGLLGSSFLKWLLSLLTSVHFLHTLEARRSLLCKWNAGLVVTDVQHASEVDKLNFLGWIVLVYSGCFGQESEREIFQKHFGCMGQKNKRKWRHTTGTGTLG